MYSKVLWLNAAVKSYVATNGHVVGHGYQFTNLSNYMATSAVRLSCVRAIITHHVVKKCSAKRADWLQQFIANTSRSCSPRWLQATVYPGGCLLSIGCRTDRRQDWQTWQRQHISGGYK